MSILFSHNKQADVENLEIRAAAFRLIQDIEDYNRPGDMKKQLYHTGIQIQIMNQILARQTKAIMSLIRL